MNSVTLLRHNVNFTMKKYILLILLITIVWAQKIPNIRQSVSPKHVRPTIRSQFGPSSVWASFQASARADI